MIFRCLLVGLPGLEPGTKGFTLPGISPRVDYLITRSLHLHSGGLVGCGTL